MLIHATKKSVTTFLRPVAGADRPALSGQGSRDWSKYVNVIGAISEALNLDVLVQKNSRRL